MKHLSRENSELFVTTFDVTFQTNGFPRRLISWRSWESLSYIYTLKLKTLFEEAVETPHDRQFRLPLDHVTTACSIARLERRSHSLPGEYSKRPISYLLISNLRTLIVRYGKGVNISLTSLALWRADPWYIFRLLKSLYKGRGRRKGRTAVTCSAICVK